MNVRLWWARCRWTVSTTMTTWRWWTGATAAWTPVTITFTITSTDFAFVNARCRIMGPLGYWVVDTYATRVDFHSRTGFLRFNRITQAIIINETETTRSTSLKKNASEFNTSSELLVYGQMTTYMRIINDIDALNITIMWEDIVNRIFCCHTAQTEYSETSSFRWCFLWITNRSKEIKLKFWFLIGSSER